MLCPKIKQIFRNILGGLLVHKFSPRLVFNRNDLRVAQERWARSERIDKNSCRLYLRILVNQTQQTNEVYPINIVNLIVKPKSRIF